MLDRRTERGYGGHCRLAGQNLATGELTVIDSDIGDFRAFFAINGNNLAYVKYDSTDNRGQTGTTYLRNIATGQTQVVSNEVASWPAVYGNRVAYYTTTNQVRLWDNGTLSTLATWGYTPIVNENYVLWGNRDGTQSLKDLRTGTTETLNTMAFRAFRGNTLTWLDWPNVGESGPATVYGMDLDTRVVQTKATLTTFDSRDEYVFGNGFLGYIQNNTVHRLDYATGIDSVVYAMQSSSDSQDMSQSLLKTDGTSLVWCTVSYALVDTPWGPDFGEASVRVMYDGPRGLLNVSSDSGDNFNIYADISGDHVIYDPGMSSVPEPSSLVLLAGLGVGLLLWRRRR